jgi:DNA-binding CsgD family transcriptional regulator
MTQPHASVAQLSDREKAVLRLLSKSHDPKSIARELGLSVHTVNEYLRSAPRKLAVGSSREAARLLSDHEAASSKILGDDKFGVENARAPHDCPRDRPGHRFSGRHMVFAIGATFAMSMIIAAALFTWLAAAPAPTGPLFNWSTSATVPSGPNLVRNRIHLDGRRLIWNGSPISELQARQYLDITKMMSPQPLLVFSASADASAEDRQRARTLIDEVLTCTPSLCVEIVAPAP